MTDTPSDQAAPTDIELLALCLVAIPRMAKAQKNTGLSTDLRVAALNAEVGLRGLEIACRIESLKT